MGRTLSWILGAVLRAGAKAGTIPCIRCGNRIMINIPAFLRPLGAEPDDPQ